MKELLDVLPEVSAALRAGRAVVALESTIITHGMPYPDNVAMAEQVEAAIRGQGAVPALVAVIDGRIKLGTTTEERDRLARMTGVRKLSRADLAYAVAQGESGGTTVAATMMVAAAGGVQVFATGGIGGVHRGAESTFDISADLTELGRTNVIVVAAGAKAILDIPKTLEVLETQGVPVVGFGTSEMPAFWSRSSGLAAPLRLDTAEAVAAFQRARNATHAAGGMLVANPIPAADEIPAHEIGVAIEAALAEAGGKNISGKAVTPFLLQRVLELTKGKSLASNIALVKNNARVAADIACALAG